MGLTPFYDARGEINPQKADFAMKQTNICRLSGDIKKKNDTVISSNVSVLVSNTLNSPIHSKNSNKKSYLINGVKTIIHKPSDQRRLANCKKMNTNHLINRNFGLMLQNVLYGSLNTVSILLKYLHTRTMIIQNLVTRIC